MKKNILIFAALLIVVSTALSSCGLVVFGDPTPNNSGEKYISEKDALEKAAEHFSLDLEECRVVKCELDEGEYEVELYFEGKEYETEVDAFSGKVFDADVDREDKW